MKLPIEIGHSATGNPKGKPYHVDDEIQVVSGKDPAGYFDIISDHDPEWK